jgi:hypothetical protein
MGVLDDAIREHLDLRRRQGVAEEELRRQAEEALGPARREVAPAEADEDGNGAAAGAAEAEGEVGPDTADEPVAETEVAEAPPDLEPEPEPPSELVLDEPTEAHVPARGSVVDEAPPRAGDTPPQGYEELDDDELLDEEELPLEEEPAPHAGEPLPHDEDPLPHDEESLPHEELADDDEASEGDDADLLEDTPDFLQETPEHDRLWFEQKPPRDFDFD